MSRLPLAARAYVEDGKIRDYLLDPAHPQNGGKAGLFFRFGFTRDKWEILAAALRQHAVINQVDKVEISPHGVKFVVKCHLMTPDGRNPCLKSVWIIREDETLPRLVTAC